MPMSSLKRKNNQYGNCSGGAKYFREPCRTFLKFLKLWSIEKKYIVYLLRLFSNTETTS
jgi:hypothetical protein